MVSFDFSSLYQIIHKYDITNESSKSILDRIKEYNKICTELLDKYQLLTNYLITFCLVKQKVRDYEIDKILKFL